MVQRDKERKKEDIYAVIKQEEKRDKIKFYTRMTLSTSIVMLVLVTYCLGYVAVGTAEYYICLFTVGINFFIILLVLITLKRIKNKPVMSTRSKPYNLEKSTKIEGKNREDSAL